MFLILTGSTPKEPLTYLGETLISRSANLVDLKVMLTQAKNQCRINEKQVRTSLPLSVIDCSLVTEFSTLQPSSPKKQPGQVLRSKSGSAAGSKASKGGGQSGSSTIFEGSDDDLSVTGQWRVDAVTILFVFVCKMLLATQSNRGSRYKLFLFVFRR